MGAKLWKRDKKKKVLRVVSSKSMLKELPTQSLSDNSSGKISRGVLSQLLGHQILVLRYYVASDIHLGKKEREILQAQEKLPKRP